MVGGCGRGRGHHEEPFSRDHDVRDVEIDDLRRQVQQLTERLEHCESQSRCDLRKQIRDVISLQTYWSYIDLYKLAIIVEKQLKQKSLRTSSLRPLLTNEEISRASTALFLLLPAEASLAAIRGAWLESSSSSREDSLKQENGSSVCAVKLILGHLENEEFNESEDVKDIEEEEVIWHLNEELWIVQLTKYDFRGAVGHLVASIPGIHNHNTRYPLDSMHFLSFQWTPAATALYRSVAEWGDLGFLCQDVASGSEIRVLKALLGARDAVLEIRFHIRQMGEAAGVPVTAIVTTNLNKIIDVNYYPVETAKRSNLRHRPIVTLQINDFAEAVDFFKSYKFGALAVTECDKLVYRTWICKCACVSKLV
ncbi:hypothetical protein HHK36_022195 [Tetracentron sinense]|uniref:Uncharacterized protein n=1 Tax=Tetracentron sinense TaxID=13715 RepID=A0A834YP32_TETSI|nr:hypothetical protein HHK36_022195 [Tetracentron sinense]